MKRFAVFAIAVVMSVLFAACNNADDSTVPSKQTSAQSTENTKSTNSTRETTERTTERTTRATEKTTEKTTRERTTESGTGSTSQENDLFEEGTVSSGSGEGVIDQIEDNMTR